MITKLSPVAMPARRTNGGFTLVELLVSMFVVCLIFLMVAQLMTSATAITRAGNKHIDTDTQARLVFDRMALDFAQMLKRTDVDYFVKGPANYNNHGHGNGGTGHGWGRGLGTNQQGSDQIAFFSQVPGYYPSGPQSPISLVAYRVNQRNASNNASYLRLERMGKGLHWNGVDDNLDITNQNAICPILFLPQTIDVVKPWSAAVNNSNSCNGTNASCDPDYETIGPGVFRFEYYYLLKNGLVTDIPWDQEVRQTQTSLTNPVNIGLSDVEAIAVTIAVIDPAGRAMIDAASPDTLLDLASDMADFRSSPGRGVGGAHRIGDVEDSWKTVVETVAATGRTSSNTPAPPEAAKAIRIYTRYFDLKNL
jgi:prepilin-type N-terminal cleavage/methylation domain-containing protein